MLFGNAIIIFWFVGKQDFVNWVALRLVVHAINFAIYASNTQQEGTYNVRQVWEKNLFIRLLIKGEIISKSILIIIYNSILNVK